MPRYLFVAATLGEIRPILEAFGMSSAFDEASKPNLFKRKAFDALVTGVGQMQTAFHLGRALTQERYSGVINLGIAGSFRDEFAPCSLVQIVQEELADLGAELEGEPLDLFEMSLLDPDQVPFHRGALRPTEFTLKALEGLPRVRSVTVNRVLHTEDSIKAVQSKYNPDVVNMEGAAVFYVCGLLQVPSLSVRAISDKVGRRDKSKWDIPGAVRNLCLKAQEILAELPK